MRAVQKGTSVNIMGKEFSVACSEEEREELEAAASFLDSRMRAIQRSGKVIGAERCAIMAALNITHEFLTLRNQSSETEEVESRVKLLNEKIETAMKQQKELSL
ncbi:MAG: cell division protein ZapA [Gammaproteobacteria bacterium]|nr:cell division protein ZapA [Gammaproteobacteria bacterium]